MVNRYNDYYMPTDKTRRLIFNQYLTVDCRCEREIPEAAMDGGLIVSTETTADVEVISAREMWSEYRLADGTVLRVKPIMISVSRGDDGNTGSDPVYNMKSTLVTDVRSAGR